MVLSHLRAVALLASLSGVAFAQEPRTGPAASASAKPALTEAEFARIEQLGAVALSPNGKWVAYDFRRGASGPTELRYRAVSGGDESSVPLGNNPLFSSNGRWLLFVLSPDTSMARLGGAGRRGGAAVGTRGGASAETNHNKVGIVDLGSGAKTVLSDIQSFALSKDGAHVALRRYAAADTHAHGADVVVRDLEEGTDLTFGNVTDFAWNDDGTLLAMIVDVEGKTGNGVQLLNVVTGALRPLDTGDHQYVGLSWRKHGSDLAVLRSRADSAFADTGYTVLAWRGLSGARASKASYEFADDRAFPAGMRVAASRAPLWAEDSSTVFFGIAPRDPKVPASWNGAAPARVEVWHWKDLREYHQQDRQSSQDRQKTQLVAWRLADNRVVRLADDTLDAVTLADGQRIALTSDERPYFDEQISGRPYRDIYRVDPATGQRERIIVKTAFPAATSPAGRYVLFAQGGHWWTYDLTSKARVNLTARIPSAFVNMEDDHPVHERRPYGVGGWTTGDRSVILYDRYDLWQVAPDGSNPVRLTRGREDSTVYRIEMLDPDLRAIDPAKPLTLSATGDWNKKSGYARLTIGQPAQRLLWVDRSVTRLIQAKNAPNVYAYVSQSAEEPPNVFVTTTSLADARQISHTNAFLGDYAWGKQVLMEYTTSRGDQLQMMLTYPANYEPGKQYPMVVYYYEKLSQGFHQWQAPTDRSTYNTSVFSQNGYFVLRPDIAFRYREPGYSGLDCVTSAVKAALATGMIDPKRVGNMGHSWGGYQSAFYAVHGHGMFAATIAGAPLTDLISMYGYTSFNTGMPETGHYETGQERMQVSLWEDPQAYIRNSTVFAVDSLQTPLLLEEGDADGNVNYWQSMELYNFGRRLGKEVVFLIYNDENHGVARPESQIDYHRRQLEWFAHFLKGEPPADWITHGESYLARQRMLNAYKAAQEAPRAPAVQAGTSVDGASRGVQRP
ncbi:MAG: prolyl oligopeptidase family serine peptidase [Gemmatimonadaceae bacterium]